MLYGSKIEIYAHYGSYCDIICQQQIHSKIIDNEKVTKSMCFDNKYKLVFEQMKIDVDCGIVIFKAINMLSNCSMEVTKQ